MSTIARSTDRSSPRIVGLSADWLALLTALALAALVRAGIIGRIPW